jgi:predicted XRE-type DNA-binding protein
MSFDLELSPKEEAASDFVALVGEKLQLALLHRKSTHRLTQQRLAEKLDVGRSRVNRCFSGANNLTIATLAELAWALDSEITFDLVPSEDGHLAGGNFPQLEQDLSTIANQAEFRSFGGSNRASQVSQTNAFTGAQTWR